MKLKLLISIALALGFSGANLSAATIVFSSSYLATDGTSVSTTGTLLEAFNFSGGVTASDYDTTVNTVLFSGKTNGLTTNAYANPTGTYYSSNSNNVTPVAGDNYNPIPTGYTAYDTMLSRFLWGGGTTITLSNLTINQEYMFQLFEADTRTIATSFTAEVTNTVGAVTSTFNTTQTYGGNSRSGFVIDGTFVADATTQTFTLRRNDGFHLNAYQLRQIPEPSTALLGGLGLLTLLRRRR